MYEEQTHKIEDGYEKPEEEQAQPAAENPQFQEIPNQEESFKDKLMSNLNYYGNEAKEKLIQAKDKTQEIGIDIGKKLQETANKMSPMMETVNEKVGKPIVHYTGIAAEKIRGLFDFS